MFIGIVSIDAGRVFVRWVITNKSMIRATGMVSIRACDSKYCNLNFLQITCYIRF